MTPQQLEERLRSGLGHVLMTSAFFDALHLAVWEAVSNAIRHAATPDPAVDVRTEPTGDVVVTVTDHGPGFDRAEISHITAPYRGLALIAANVTSVAYSPAPEGGTIVTLRKALPRNDR
ncbi:ATP-binding protein [Spirillospora sp. NPDC000708]